MEQDAINQEEAQAEAYEYFMRTDPGMRKFLGPIETKYDPVTDRMMRQRQAKIGMVRNSKEENLKDVVVYLDPHPHIRTDSAKDLQGWYSPKTITHPGMRPRPCFTDAVLTQPYGGYCPVGCGFCYINAGSRGYRGSGLMSVPLNYGAHVRRQLASMKVSAAGYFSSFTDPFQAVEGFYHNTQQGAQAFVDAGLPIFFLSRLVYPDWAIDMLTRNPHSYAQKSLNTPHQDDWEKLSPGAASLSDHMDQIGDLKERGIYVSIQVNPVIAGIVSHEDIEQLFEGLAFAGADHVIVKFVEANIPWAGAMVQKMEKKFGANRTAHFRELFTENSCGAQRTVQREYRLEGIRRYQAKATQLGMTFSLCYEYDRGTDGKWRSIGKDWVTSEQCHGHAVPMYTRQPGGLFAPLGVCPPSGCLHCADDNEGAPRCGSELLGSAKDLRISDLRRDPGFTPPRS